jgi:hypothetical protein
MQQQLAGFLQTALSELEQLQLCAVAPALVACLAEQGLPTRQQQGQALLQLAAAQSTMGALSYSSVAAMDRVGYSTAIDAIFIPGVTPDTALLESAECFM